jgi:hypothetical protein
MKTMYLLIGILTVLMLCIFITSCGKEHDEPDNSIISVEETELTFSQISESKDFNISSPGEWYIDAEGLEVYLGVDAASIKNFIIYPISGKGNTKITVELKNEITEDYSIDLKIIGKNNQVVVKLKALAE